MIWILASCLDTRPTAIVTGAHALLAMFENDTVYNSTHTNSTSSIGGIVFSPGLCVELALLLLSTIIFIIGLTSWIIIRNFRHFKNYVFLSIILCNIMNIVAPILYRLWKKYKIQNEVVQHLVAIPYLYFKLSVNCWLVVLCYVFYVDFVKVLGGDVTRKYLKSNLFAWGIPSLSVVWNVFVMRYIEKNAKIAAPIYITSVFVPLIVNLFIYIRVVYALLKVDVHDKSDRCGRIQASTVIFFVSGLLMLLVPLQRLVWVPDFLVLLLAHLQTFAIDVYFLAIKINRKVWRNYYAKRIRKMNLKVWFDLPFILFNFLTVYKCCNELCQVYNSNVRLNTKVHKSI